MYAKKSPKIGEVYAVNFEKNFSEQTGFRPAVVIQNKLGNIFGKNIIVLPITSSQRKADLPTHVKLIADDTGLRNDSIVLCEHPVTIPKSYLRKHITTLNDEYIKKIAKAYILSSGLISLLDEQEVIDVWNESKNLNMTDKEGVKLGP